MSSETDLLALQRNFMAAIREPIYGGSRKLSFLPPRDGEVSSKFAALAESEIRSTPNLEATERLELYHRQYWFRLLDTISEDFPALKRLLGEDTFWRLIEAYLEQVPSRSYNMRRLGNGLADFTEHNRHLAGEYPVHAAELARLEYTLCDVFDAASFPAVPAENLGQAGLALQPHVRLLALRTRVDEIRQLAKEAEIPAELLPPPTAEPQFRVAVFRHQGRATARRLPVQAFLLLQSISETGSLETALESMPDVNVIELGNWFRDWTELGWLYEHSATNHS